MEKIVYESPKKHRIMIVEDLLAKNNIPVTSVKIHINVRGRESRDDLDIPIEDFTEKLNDAQTFELYIDSQDEERAFELVSAWCNNPESFDDCIYLSQDYDEVFDVYLQLHRNNIPCSDVITFFADDNSETYILFTEPENKETALEFINQKIRKVKGDYEE